MSGRTAKKADAVPPSSADSRSALLPSVCVWEFGRESLGTSPGLVLVTWLHPCRSSASLQEQLSPFMQWPRRILPMHGAPEKLSRALQHLPHPACRQSSPCSCVGCPAFCLPVFSPQAAACWLSWPNTSQRTGADSSVAQGGRSPAALCLPTHFCLSAALSQRR